MAALVVSVVGNIAAGFKELNSRWKEKTVTDAQRVDAAHASQVQTLVDRVNDNERRFEEVLSQHQALTQQHLNCEKLQAQLSGRICLLELQSKECVEDRQRLHRELTAIKNRV